ncbi:hypothetical protein B0H13DRAFT_1869426 [Mycena leptocephala]|nr:hypothetical protein B0H13DRAFT_1869426 [Mycena leptocephala]
MSDNEDPADILNDALEFLGGTKVVGDEVISTGPAPHCRGQGNLDWAEESSVRDGPPISVNVYCRGRRTDYPDPGILGNLVRNVERNNHLVSPGCTVRCCGYEWGNDVAPLFSHDVLVSSIDALLARSPDARVHVAAGNYTKPQVCDNFLQLSERADQEREWLGRSAVSGLDKIALRTRKAACRYWIEFVRQTIREENLIIIGRAV